MGPTAVFDKSFLQGLSVDESVWFDHFFVSIITPLFFVETLADLGKEKIRSGRSPEDEVRILADKTPEMNSVPHVFHATICHGELLGHSVPFQGRPVIPEGRRAVVGEKKGIVIGISPEAEALQRWRNEEFMEVEHRYARSWREGLSGARREAGNRFLAYYEAEVLECTTRPQLHSLARSIVHDRLRKPSDRMGFAFDVLGLTEDRDRIYERFIQAGAPPLATYTPYTAHVLEVEVYFRFAMARGIEAKERASNWVDIAYLNYLPFCHILVSNDRLHRENAPLFLRGYQTFVPGEDLKADLKRLDERYKALPAEVRERSLLHFARRPPTDGDFLTARLWDLAMRPDWRTPRPVELSDVVEKRFIASMKAMKEKARTQSEPPPDFPTDEADSFTVERRVRRRKGSWLQMPPEVTG